MVPACRKWRTDGKRLSFRDSRWDGNGAKERKSVSRKVSPVMFHRKKNQTKAKRVLS